MTIQEGPTSKIWTMSGWVSRPAASASCRKRFSNCSRSAGVMNSDSRMTLMATGRLRRGSTQR